MQHKTIAIIGASGGIGAALVDALAADSTIRVYAFSRAPAGRSLANVHWRQIDYANESTIESAAENLGEIALDLVIVATGFLHDHQFRPEKSLRDISADNFLKSFLVNAIGPALVAKYFIPKLNRQGHSLFAFLSARVGSIEDNRLGGWYAYRASKAALNMLIKNISLEVARSHKHSIIVGLHPGTVDTLLSKPFQQRITKHRIFTPQYCATKLLKVIDNLGVHDNGKILAWDGSRVPY